MTPEIPDAAPYCTCGSRDGGHILACGINGAARTDARAADRKAAPDHAEEATA